MSADRYDPIQESAEEPRALSRWRRRVAFAVFAAVAAYFLWTEHRAHAIQALPWLLLMACPLMHVFVHRGHGSHGHDR